MRGVELADSALRTVSPRATLSPGGGDDAKNSRQTWRQRHGQASPSPFRLWDIAGARPHGPNALLLIPLKLRDGAHAHSGLPPPLASILLAPKSLKKPGHPHQGAGHKKAKETLQELGNAGRKSWEIGEEREPHDPYL